MLHLKPLNIASSIFDILKAQLYLESDTNELEFIKADVAFITHMLCKSQRGYSMEDYIIPAHPFVCLQGWAPCMFDINKFRL